MHKCVSCEHRHLVVNAGDEMSEVDSIHVRVCSSGDRSMLESCWRHEDEQASE